MKLGLFLMPLHRPERLHADTYEEDLELMAFADRLGYSEAWIGEHFTLPWENMPSPELFIARALGVTEQMKFGTGVSLLHYHNPVHVAHRIAMLDHMARGRLYFGIGSAGSPTDTEMFGVDLEAGTLRERMQESIEVILKVWQGEPFEHKGRFFNVTLPKARPEARLGFHMMPYQKPHPPVAVAGSSPYSDTLAMVGERGWMPLSTCFLYETYLPSHWQVVEKGANKAGRVASRGEWRISREVYVASNSQKARKEALEGPLGRFFVDYWIPLLGHGARGLSGLKHDPELPDEALTPEYMLEHLWIVGDPDECAEKIRKLYQDVGGFGTLLPLCHDWEGDRKKWFRSLELMSKEVLPALQDLAP
jgi:alkanesulfonate monooxygenase SsuD/methylene tetrahydromethanopterin reductase-like flavin-dependent oxidoreductase (luciferase family)